MLCRLKYMAAKDFKVVSPRLFQFEVPPSELKGEGLKPRIPAKQAKARTIEIKEASIAPQSPVEELEPGFPNDPGPTLC